MPQQLQEEPKSAKKIGIIKVIKICIPVVSYIFPELCNRFGPLELSVLVVKA